LARATKEQSPEFIIRHEKLDLHIYLSSLSKLLLHEKTIPDRVDQLKREFLDDQMVKDPIVVDADSCVVLDGMHRVAALRELNCVCIPVCAVDYLSPSIKVGAWYRAFSGASSPDQVRVALSAVGIRVTGCPFDFANIMKNPALAVLFADGECLKLQNSDLRVFETVEIAEQCIRQIGLAVKFETEHDALENLANKRTNIIMSLPKIDKTLVREAGLTGRVLPHKVTRHIIPARPLAVDVPLKTLTDGVATLQESNRRFVMSLESRRITRSMSGAIIGGRRYEEETFIFS